MEAPITVRAGVSGPRRRSFVIDCAEELTHLNEREVWFEADDAVLTSELMDYALVATLMLGMVNGRDIRIEGALLRRLHANAYEFQQAWAAWRPDLFGDIDAMARGGYAVVDIEAAALVDATVRPMRAAQAFSGGLDSIYTMAAHTRLRPSAWRRPLDRAVFVHGFDIGLDKKADFDLAAAKARAIADDAGVSLTTVATNLRSAVRIDWEMYHGAAIAAVLLLFAPGYTEGLIGSTEPYADLITPWGSNPITDPLLSGALDIVHDGAGATRAEKTRAIADWSVALENMRVCWRSADKSKNCGRCEKCIRTALTFRAWGYPVPPCFERDITVSDIDAVEIGNAVQYLELKRVLDLAQSNAGWGNWIDALRRKLAAATPRFGRN